MIFPWAQLSTSWTDWILWSTACCSNLVMIICHPISMDLVLYLEAKKDWYIINTACKLQEKWVGGDNAYELGKEELDQQFASLVSHLSHFLKKYHCQACLGRLFVFQIGGQKQSQPKGFILTLLSRDWLVIVNFLVKHWGKTGALSRGEPNFRHLGFRGSFWIKFS